MEAPPSTRRAYYDFSSMDILIDDTRVDYFASLGLHMALGDNVRFEGQRNRLGRILASRVQVDDVAYDIEPGLLAKVLREKPEFMAIDASVTLNGLHPLEASLRVEVRLDQCDLMRPSRMSQSCLSLECRVVPPRNLALDRQRDFRNQSHLARRLIMRCV